MHLFNSRLVFQIPARAVRRLAALAFMAALLFFVGQAPAFAKYASLVIDADTGEVLHSANADMQNYPASLTKMMTLYLLFDALDEGTAHLNDRMPVSAHAAAQAPSKLGLRPGQTLRVEDAVLGLCTKSANDAAVTVAEFLGETESGFAEMMTRKARELGMRQTTFRNASGLPNLGQKSTARDMATLAHALIHHHAKDYHYFSTRQFVYNGEVMNNHNHLMEHYEGADGIKTGFIAASGFNLVASAKRNGRRLIGVVFGGDSAPSRDRHMAKLLDAAFARSPGSSGVDMASMPEQTEDAETAQDATPDLQAVMKAMAATKAIQQTSAKLVDDEDAKPAPVARAKILAHRAPAAEPDASGDADEDKWGIQVGAYAQQGKAKIAADAAMRKLGKLVADGDVSIAAGKGHHRHKIFRARLIGLPEETAREACRRLGKAHTPCSVINTGVTVASR